MKPTIVSLFAAILCISPLLAQTPPPAQPQLSPKAAYADAMQPLESTRAQVANWSDAEIAALKVTITRAAENCQARHPENFDGDTLIDLAKLCALGQSWPAVVQSTTRYINAADSSKPRLDEAYAAQIDANLHLKDHGSALAGAHAMLNRRLGHGNRRNSQHRKQHRCPSPGPRPPCPHSLISCNHLPQSRRFCTNEMRPAPVCYPQLRTKQTE